MQTGEYVELARIGFWKCALLESLFREAGIDFYLLDEMMNSIYGGGIRVMVRSDHAEAARLLLN